MKTDTRPNIASPRPGPAFTRAARWLTALAAGVVLQHAAHAQTDTECAKVKIEIQQELTLERQAFDAQMTINNTTDSGTIESVSVTVKVTDENGTPVQVTDDPNNLAAQFFVRVSSLDQISDVAGGGTVPPRTNSTIHWLIIPTVGSAGTSPLGKKYMVGATLNYRYAGQDAVVDVAPDVITVKPLPLLTLDYFLTQDVEADDPLTPEIEPVVPFTLGVRVKNSGVGIAHDVKIDSAQPKIIDNQQGLAINFTLTGSYVDDAPAQNTLLLGFGDLVSGQSRVGRWIMQTTLSGRFTDFTARFSHSDELGGALTSLLQATNAHFLIHDVRVDLPGRDAVRDFLAQDGDVVRVYESEGLDTLVTDRSSSSTLTGSVDGDGVAHYHLSMPPTAGFVYARLPDPFQGTKAFGSAVRSDAKTLLADNVWFSRTRNEQTKQWQYWINFFDVNTTGEYDTLLTPPSAAPRAPVIQFVPDHIVKELNQVSFLVEASSPDGRPVQLSAAPLPAGATFTVQAADPQAPGLTRALFDWTPAKGMAGSYLVTYTANDGTLSSALSAGIVVNPDAPPPGPGKPSIVAPLGGAQVTTQQPSLSVQASTDSGDPTTSLQFEVYADEAMSRLVASGSEDKAGNVGGVPQPTSWPLPVVLNDNTHYWWRARAGAGARNSDWVAATFFVNTFNDPPDSFNLTSPVPGSEVASATPEFAWTNSVDRDGDAVTYVVSVFRDAALTQLAVASPALAADPGGTTKWVAGAALANHAHYWWSVVAQDALGAQTATPARSFTVDTGNNAPSAPVPASPADGGQSTTADTVLTVANATDLDNDLLTLVFEIDTVPTFDSADRRASGQIIQGSGDTTSWTAAGLVENKRYWWRVKAQDGRAESAWAGASFLLNAVNEAPPAPTIANPGDGAWSATQQPTLQVNPVVDPEGEAVSYQFEVFTDAALTVKVADGSSPTTSFVVPSPLADKTTHWWHARALDPHGAASAWTPAAKLYVSTGPYQAPTLSVTSPAMPVLPNASGGGSTGTINWTGTDNNIDPTIALYWTHTTSGYTGGTLIVDGLKQAAGTQSGSYVWNMAGLPPGDYYVYGQIYDAKGTSRARAAGAFVVPTAPQAGKLLVTVPPNPTTTESGGFVTLGVHLNRAPTNIVVVGFSSNKPNEGKPSPAQLTFTPSNWSTDQSVKVIGQDDSKVDGDTQYKITIDVDKSLDPDFIGLVYPGGVKMVNLDNDAPARAQAQAQARSATVSTLELRSERQVDAHTWEYEIGAELRNSGVPISGAIAKIAQLPPGLEPVRDTLKFGAVGESETAKTTDVLTVRSRTRLKPHWLDSARGFKWSVVVHP